MADNIIQLNQMLVNANYLKDGTFQGFRNRPLDTLPFFLYHNPL